MSTVVSIVYFVIGMLFWAAAPGLIEEGKFLAGFLATTTGILAFTAAWLYFVRQPL